ncbi:hypothetical protein MASR1M31_25720 [Porphyromonadaceae bacterium]
MFSYGYVTIREMASAGIFMNIIALALITLFSMLLIPYVF